MTSDYSIIIPVYRNEDSIDALFDSLERIATVLGGSTEVIFINDASPDSSALVILRRMLSTPLSIRLIHHSRNFGSFAAIRTGFQVADGAYVGVISADLQEPPDLLISFFAKLKDSSTDIVFGSRNTRNDPKLSTFFSNTYWSFYRKYVNSDIPKNGVDVFACTNQVTKVLNSLKETNTSLIGMLFWIGFKREFQEYDRMARPFGKSSWTFRNKFQYMSNSVYAFSDLPIRIIRRIGFFGTSFSLMLSFFLSMASLNGQINVPGYAPIMIAILFGNSAVLIALGILGSYLWRTYENSQGRPFSVSYQESTKKGKS